MGRTDRYIPKISCYEEGDGEFNLFSMYKETVTLAFETHHGEKLRVIASKLGVHENTLRAWCDTLNLTFLIKENINS